MTGRPAASASTAPAPRSASVMSGQAPRAPGCHSTVGWNCTNSRSRRSAPARAASASPSPVSPAGLVVVANAWPNPPLARTTARAAITPGNSSPGPAWPHAPSWPPWARPASRPVTRPAGSVTRSSATHRPRISTWLSARAARSTRCTSAPAASPPACTIRLQLCPPSRCSGWRSSRAPSAASRVISRGAVRARSATAAGSHSPAPAATVSRRWLATLSPGPTAAARPPWASGVAPAPSPSLVTSRTRRPCRAAARAALIPAAPEPTTTTSGDRSQRGCGRGRPNTRSPLTPCPPRSRPPPWPAPRGGPGPPPPAAPAPRSPRPAGSAAAPPESSSSCTGRPRRD